MKTLKFLLTFVVIGMLAVTSKAQNVDEILKKHANAIRGMENWAKIKTMKMVLSV